MSRANFDNIILSLADLFFVSKLQTALESQDCSVRLAPHETDIMKAIENDPPDLLILDLENSQHDPQTIIRNIRKGERSKEIPVLAFTNHTKLLEWESKLKDPKSVVVSNNFISTYISDVARLRLLFETDKESNTENE